MAMKQITYEVKKEWNEKGTPVVLNRKQKRTFKALLPKFNYVRKTVRQFFKWISDDIVDCLPIGQRLCIQGETTDKSREIIESMFLGISINTITLTKTFAGSEYEYESVDGGHRKRAIRGFLRNKFRVFGKYFKEFDKKDKQSFFNYELNFCIYEPLTNAMKGQVFQTLNKTTEVSDQEMLNSFGDIPIANVVRQTVRPVKSVDEVHPLFTKTNSKKHYIYIDYNNNRLRLEEFVMRIYYRYYIDGCIGAMVRNDSIAMYSDESLEDVTKLKKKVTKHLDFLTTMAQEKQNLELGKLGWKELNTLSKMFFYLNEKLIGGWNFNKTSGSELMYKNFNKVFNDYINDPKERWTDLIDFEWESDKVRKTVSISGCFNNYTTINSSKEIQIQLMEWVFAELDLSECIIVKSPQRLFTKKIKETCLAAQGMRCAIDNNRLTYKGAEGAHDLAWILGGSTDYSNCFMVRKVHNRNMGIMSIQEYCDWGNFPGPDGLEND
jgi:hypothetical protein